MHQVEEREPLALQPGDRLPGTGEGQFGPGGLLRRERFGDPQPVALGRAIGPLGLAAEPAGDPELRRRVVGGVRPRPGEPLGVPAQRVGQLEAAVPALAEQADPDEFAQVLVRGRPADSRHRGRRLDGAVGARVVGEQPVDPRRGFGKPVVLRVPERLHHRSTSTRALQAPVLVGEFFHRSAERPARPAVRSGAGCPQGRRR